MKLFNNFDDYDESVALIFEGKLITYRELQFLIDEVKVQINREEPALVFIEVTNNVSSIVSYLACMQLSFPVLLLNAASAKQNQDIIFNYQPNIIINAKNDQLVIAENNNAKIDLHRDLSLLLATSGSTGSPKLVKLSSQNIYANTTSIIEYLSIKPADRAITSLKFNYSYGLSIINSYLQAGASIVLTESSITDDEFWSLFQKYKVTNFSGVPYSFEVLAKKGVFFDEFPHVRYLTQAGGKLSPQLVTLFAEKGRLADIEFFVMYGQTEAAPRISYLPSEFASEFPEYIGIAVPGGKLFLVDENKKKIDLINIEGELGYQGPNVMMGYANSVEELSIKTIIPILYTGDIAVMNEKKLFKIVGRSSRFVKPFGIRISLDDIQNQLTDLGYIAAVAGAQELVSIVIESIEEQPNNDIDVESILQHLENVFGVSSVIYKIYILSKIPLLQNGKIDYKTVANLLKGDEADSNKWRQFFGFFKEEVLLRLGIGNDWDSVKCIYLHYFSAKNITDDCSFISHAGDSLLYVSLSIELEKYLGYLPENWHLKSVSELELLKNSESL